MLVQLTLPESPDVIRIPLGHDLFTLIDARDYALVSKYRWYPCPKNRKNLGEWYARTARPGFKSVRMHRLILGAMKGQEVDHINGDSLDNRRSNLRFCTHSQNMINCKRPSTATSLYRGVYRDKETGRWRVGVTVDGKWRNLGRFDTQEQAATFYNEAVVRLHGEYARLNVL